MSTAEQARQRYGGDANGMDAPSLASEHLETLRRQAISN
jgi:hypothetical protein